MSEDLNPIERSLERLEAAVVREYEACKLEAEREAKNRIVLAEEKLERFTAELDALKSALYTTGDATQLKIVCERHDGLRIRMIYLGHLLEREIPRPYVDEALHDYARAPDYRNETSQPRTATERAAATASSPSLLRRLFQRGGAASSGSASQSPRAASGTPKNERHLVRLHKLMEQDRLHLLREEERVPHVAFGAAAPSAPAQFTSRDVAEARMGERVERPRETIARTPEELRAKFAQRDKSKEDPKSG